MRRKYLYFILPVLALSSCGSTPSAPKEHILDKIEVTNNPTKMEYTVGESFSPLGMEVTAFYQDDTSHVVEDYSYLPYGGLDITDTTIRIAYREDDITKETTLNIKVNPKIDLVCFNNLPESIELEVGEELSLYPTKKDGFLTNGNIKILSSNKNLLGVEENKLIPYYEGETSITIYSDDNYNGLHDDDEIYMSIDVSINEASNVIKTRDVYVENMAVDAYLFSTYQMNSFVTPYNATYRKIKYISSDESISEVDENGNVYNKAVGDAIITAFNDINNNDVLDEGEASKFAIFCVREPETQYNISLEKEEITIACGQTYDISSEVRVTPSMSTGSYLGYQSFNNNIARISNGKIKGVFPGKARIEVRYQGAYSYINVNVTEAKAGMYPSINKLTVNSDSLLLNKGETINLSYNYCPLTSQDEIAFTSSNTEIASISSSGEISALSAGKCVISIKSGSYIDRVELLVQDEINNEETYDGYYENLSWENGEDLVNKLHTIIRDGYSPLGYSNPTNWETNQYADEDINDNTMVNALYSSEPILKTNTTKGWQREHAFAASLMTGLSTGVAVTHKGRGTDFHNLYAANASGNSSRGNKNFGYADILDPSFSNGSDWTFDRYNFEPSDEDKGKVARSIFYMAIMYNDFEIGTVKETWIFKTPEDISSHSTQRKTLTFNVDFKPIEITETYVGFNKVSVDNFLAKSSNAAALLNEHFANELKEKGSTFAETSDEFRRDAYALYVSKYSVNAIGNLSTLLKWNSYKVDQQEYNHNVSVYSHVGIAVNKGIKQGNRNPFVDYPMLAEYIFGALKNTPGSLADLSASKDLL